MTESASVLAAALDLAENEVDFGDALPLCAWAHHRGFPTFDSSFTEAAGFRSVQGA